MLNLKPSIQPPRRPLNSLQAKNWYWHYILSKANAKWKGWVIYQQT